MQGRALLLLRGPLSTAWCGWEAVCVQCGVLQPHTPQSHCGQHWMHHYYPIFVVQGRTVLCMTNPVLNLLFFLFIKKNSLK